MITTRQQINLFQPIFRQQRKLFPAGTVALGLLLVLATLISLWAFGAWKVTRLEDAVIVVREQQRAQEHMVSAAGKLHAARANPVEVQARIARLSAELADRSRALDLLRGGATGRTTGFAGRLAALARQHADGLWLDHMVLAGDASSMSLSGGAINPALVPRYLQALASEPALSGVRFDEFVIERPEDQPGAQPGVRFRAGNAALNDAATSDKDKERL